MARTSRKRAATAPPSRERVWNACIYARLSSEDQGKKERDSIGNQIALLERYIEGRPDLKLVAVFQDLNQTGTNFERPGFQKMMEAVKNGKVDCIVVKDLSRFGRNYIETGAFLENVFPFLGVRFISVNDGYDSFAPHHQLESYVIPLKNILHELYARDISQKTKSALEVLRRQGKFTGPVAAYGFRKGDDGKLEVEEETAPIVQTIFQWAKEGAGGLRIAQKLNELGISPPGQTCSKTGRWHKSTVQRILRNPVYLGHMVQGKTQSDLWKRGGRVSVPWEEWVVAPRTHPPLVDEETFLAVRQIKEARKGKTERACREDDSLSFALADGKAER